MREREAFQELDYRAVFGSMTKWTTEIDDPARIPEIVSRAFHTAANGRPGPVVVALPEDMLIERIAASDAPAFTPIETSPGPAEMAKLAQLLGAARAPILILGGSRWSQAASDGVARFAQKYALPVCTTFRRLHLFDALHPCYAGDLGIGPNPKLVDRIKAADLVVLIGGRMGELPSQSYTVFDIPRPQMTFVHVHPSIEELGRVYSAHLPIHATPTAFAAALEHLEVPGTLHGQAEAAHADYLAWTEKPTEQPGAVNLGAVMVWLRDNLPADAILCNGAGNYAAWIHRFFRFRRFGQHVAPTSGSMGYGVPAAVAMKRLYPERPVICFAGDGDFLMNGQEFATAVQYGLPLDRSSLRTTASTAPSACTRNANIPAALSQPSCAIRISPPMPAPLAASASPSSARRISRRHSTRRRPPASRRSSGWRSIRKRSRRPRHSPRFAPIRWRGRAGNRPSSRRRKATIAESEFILCYSAGAIPLPRCAMPYRRTENVARRLAARRDAIIAAARQTASEGGMAAVQIAAVAARAGIAAGTVYRYFPAKTDLVAALLTEIAEREIGALRRAADAAPGPLSALSAAIMTFAGRALRDRRLAFAAIAEPVDAEIDAARLAFRKSLAAEFALRIAAARAGGHLPEQDAALAAAALTGLACRRADRSAGARCVRPRARRRAVAHARCLARARGGRCARPRPRRANGKMPTDEDE